MSIEFLPYDPSRSSLTSVPPLAASRTTQRRLEANRLNAMKSTGPRTTAGKKRSSQNSIKHGLCSTSAVLEGECAATYSTFENELRAELQPKTILQHSLLPHIAQLLWRLNRVPEAQQKIFRHELEKCAKGESLSPAEILARRFSDDPHNGFLTLGRYERSLQNQLMRLLKHYDALKKNRPTMPHAAEEPPVPREGSEPAWSEEKAESQRRFFETPAGKEKLRRIQEAEASAIAERTQYDPVLNPLGATKRQICADLVPPPVTKRSHSGPGKM